MSRLYSNLKTRANKTGSEKSKVISQNKLKKDDMTLIIEIFSPHIPDSNLGQLTLLPCCLPIFVCVDDILFLNYVQLSCYHTS